MSTDVMSDAQRAEFLKGLGLSPDAPGLVDVTKPAKVKKAKQPKADKPAKAKKPKPTKEAEIDKRTIPAADVVFTLDMLDGYDVSKPADFAAASRAIFDQYKSARGVDRDRNALLHRRISEFLSAQRRGKRTGGMVTQRVETKRDTDDLAQILQQHGITAADLAALIAAKQS